MKYIKKIFFTSVLFLLIALATGAQAGEPSATLLLGTVDNFPPFSYMSEGKLTGVDIDLIEEMAKRIGISVKIQVYPWARVISALQKGEIDGGFAAFETVERKEFCLYVGVLHFEEFYIFVRKGNEFSYSGVADLYGKTIGKDRGVFVSDEFERAAKEGKINLDEVNDMDMMNIKKLTAGRIDAAIGDLGVMQYYAKLLGVEKNIIPLKPIRKSTPAYLVLSKTSPLKNKADLQKKMRVALDGMRKDWTYKRIFDRHVAKKQMAFRSQEMLQRKGAELFWLWKINLSPSHGLKFPATDIGEYHRETLRETTQLPEGNPLFTEGAFIVQLDSLTGLHQIIP